MTFVGRIELSRSRESSSGSENNRALCYRVHGYFDTRRKHPANHFNPRAPRGARPYRHGTQTIITNFNPRAPHGARRVDLKDHVDHIQISIHVPRMGHDAPPPLLL